MNLNDTLHCISTIVQTNTSRFGSQGTGFYYSRLAPGEGDGPQWRAVEDMWLVTNRHVVIPALEGVEFPPENLTFCLRKSSPSGTLDWEPIVLSALEIEKLAKFHPDNSVDVAVVNIYDVVINRMKDGNQYLGPYFLHSENLFENSCLIVWEAPSSTIRPGRMPPLLHKERAYTSDLSGGQWEIIRPLLVPERQGPGRPPELDLRRVADAIFYVVRTGCQWKNLPKDYPNHNSVCY